MEQLQGMDASFLSMETPRSPMHIGAIQIYDPSTAPGGFVRFKDLLQFYADRMQLSKTMRQKLVTVPFNIDYPYWIEDEDFDLEYHVRHVALPAPGDWRQLCIQSARIFARPLDLTRPPWEFTVIGGLDNIPGIPKGSYAVISKIHHAAIDGMSGVDLTNALHTTTPSTAPPNVPDTWKPEKPPSKTRIFAKGYARALVNPVRQVGLLGRAVPGLARTARGMIKGQFDLKAASGTPRTRFNTKISAHRVYGGERFSLADIKRLRVLAEGSKVNDVMLSIIGGGLHKYLKAKDELPDATLTAMAPISVRTESEKNTMGNQVSAMIAPLGTHIADPAERMAYVYDQTSRSKEMTNAIGARQMTEMSKVSPNLFMALGARLYSGLGLADRIKPVVNTVVTNVPGPPIPIYSAGAQMVTTFGMLCLTDGVTIGHVVQSYVDEATIGFIACRNVMPDPEFYSSCVREAFDEMMTAAGLETKATAAPEPAKPAAAKRRKAPARKAASGAAKTKSTASKTKAKSGTARKSTKRTTTSA